MGHCLVVQPVRRRRRSRSGPEHLASTLMSSKGGRSGKHEGRDTALNLYIMSSTVTTLYLQTTVTLLIVREASRRRRLQNLTNVGLKGRHSTQKLPLPREIHPGTLFRLRLIVLFDQPWDANEGPAPTDETAGGICISSNNHHRSAQARSGIPDSDRNPGSRATPRFGYIPQTHHDQFHNETTLNPLGVWDGGDFFLQPMTGLDQGDAYRAGLYADYAHLAAKISVMSESQLFRCLLTYIRIHLPTAPRARFIHETARSTDCYRGRRQEVNTLFPIFMKDTRDQIMHVVAINDFALAHAFPLVCLHFRGRDLRSKRHKAGDGASGNFHLRACLGDRAQRQRYLRYQRQRHLFRLHHRHQSCNDVSRRELDHEKRPVVNYSNFTEG